MPDPYINQVLAQLQTEIDNAEPDRNFSAKRHYTDLLDVVSEVVTHYDEPDTDESPIPTTEAGTYVECDCDGATFCPQDRVGTEAKCKIFKRSSTPPQMLPEYAIASAAYSGIKRVVKLEQKEPPLRQTGLSRFYIDVEGERYALTVTKL